MNVLKVSTANRDEVSFQANPAGDIELVHVQRDNSNPPEGPAGAPKDIKIATIPRREAGAIAEFFAKMV